MNGTIMKKIILIICSFFLVLILVGVFYVYFLLRSSLPGHEGMHSFSALQDSVEITFDAMGIPQIWANHENDAYFAMGYLHAADRLFQMDMTRRIAQGRLSELLGRTTLDIDKQQRIIGHQRIAQTSLQRLSDHNRQRLESYSQGINAYVQSSASTLPFEYQLLRLDFEPWSLYDCLTILSFQTWFSDFLMSPDAFYVRLLEQVGPERARTMSRPYPAWAPTVVPEKTPATATLDNIRQSLAGQLFGNGFLPFNMSHSSNSWVVAPSRSASGAAILASDPHLEIGRLPQFWYITGMHIRDKGIKALGITAPGLPVIIMGHNGKAAWAFTVSGVDVSEYFIEQTHPEDSTLYRTPAGWEPFEVFMDTIRVSGSKEPVLLRTKATRNGPVLFSADSLKENYALHWAGYDMDLDASIGAALNLVSIDRFSDFRETVTRLGALDASWTYADTAGNIGYQLGTPVAVRNQSNHNFPVPGWTDEFRWQGFHPLEKTPFSYNPARGWLASCNNKPDQSNLDYELEGYFAFDRILRIEELLETQETFSVADMQRFQMDLHDRYLLRWRDLLIPHLQQYGHSKWAGRLKDWDGQSGTESQETALIHGFIYQLKRDLFEAELGKLRRRISTLTLEQIMHLSAEQWAESPLTAHRTESKTELIGRVLEKTIGHVQDKTWGDLHTLTMQHPLAVVPVVRPLLGLSHGPFSWAGTAGTLNASFLIEDENNPGYFQSIVGPSWRFVIDFSDVDGATMVLPAGNSGNPMSPHFMDFFEMWKNGGRWNVPIHYEKVKERAKTRLILKP